MLSALTEGDEIPALLVWLSIPHTEDACGHLSALQ